MVWGMDYASSGMQAWSRNVKFKHGLAKFLKINSTVVFAAATIIPLTIWVLFTLWGPGGLLVG
jgi:hypothetical protein